MRIWIHSLFILFLFVSAKCEKENRYSNQLPSRTQQGRNTLGFMLNGQPWTPKGSNGTANLSIDFDSGINNGIFNISGYRINTSTNREHFGIGVKDSINFITVPKTYQLGNSSLYGIFFSSTDCTFDYFDSSIIRSGVLNITKLDKTNRIISGTFNATLSKAGCTTVQLTEGRFDMKY